TQEDLDNQIKNFVDGLPDVSITTIRLSINATNLSIGGGSWEGFVLKTTSDYWCLHLTRYGGMCLIYSYECGNVSVKILNNIANNLTTTEEGFALDARQGKVLYDLINGQSVTTTAISSSYLSSGVILERGKNTKIIVNDGKVTTQMLEKTDYVVCNLPNDLNIPNQIVKFVVLTLDGVLGRMVINNGNGVAIRIYPFTTIPVGAAMRFSEIIL
ncbi:MAG: hypothetical protein PUC65_08310, partial [Clostridiales bacterium]|nr:hypothetical protein [Clostridiales bacterium]